jgi:hypothetical protein
VKNQSRALQKIGAGPYLIIRHIFSTYYFQRKNKRTCWLLPIASRDLIPATILFLAPQGRGGRKRSAQRIFSVAVDLINRSVVPFVILPLQIFWFLKV